MDYAFKDLPDQLLGVAEVATANSWKIWLIVRCRDEKLHRRYVVQGVRDKRLPPMITVRRT